MRINNKKSFSLVELAVVVLMIGIMGATAYPYYRDYSIRATITSHLGILRKLVDVSIESYENGTLTSSSAGFMINGTWIGTTSNYTTTNLTTDPVIRVQFYTPVWTASQSGNGWMLCIRVPELHGMPGYVQPTSGSWGTYTRMCAWVVPQATGHYVVHCGQRAQGVSEIQVQYLPRGCSCPDIGQHVSAGNINIPCNDERL